MPGTIAESYLSRPFELGRNAGRELVFHIFGTEDEAEVETLILGQAPAVYSGLILDSVSADPIGGGVWKGYARYTRIDGDSEYTFDTGGGTSKITQSLATVGAYAPAGLTAPDFQGAIGCTEDRVEGVDVVIPQFEFTETHYFADTFVTGSYKLGLFYLTGRYNDATFKGLAAGECLFLGASGSKRGDEQWAITFRFGGSPNVVDQVVGDITVSAKAGWDYLWVRYADFEDGTAYSLVKRPISAYVERVYLPGDFSTLGIGT